MNRSGSHSRLFLAFFKPYLQNVWIINTIRLSSFLLFSSSRYTTYKGPKQIKSRPQFPLSLLLLQLLLARATQEYYIDTFDSIIFIIVGMSVNAVNRQQFGHHRILLLLLRWKRNTQETQIMIIIMIMVAPRALIFFVFLVKT